MKSQVRLDLITAAQHQAAADPQTKPTNLACESGYMLLLSTPTITIYQNT